MWNEYMASYIIFAKILQWGWWDLAVDGDGDVPPQGEEAAAWAEEMWRVAAQAPPGGGRP
jgi:hypothetical protein